jgi:hypothetical protein
MAKGKRKTVVAVEGMLTSIGNSVAPHIEEIWPTINGIVVEPRQSPFSGYAAEVNCPTFTTGSSASCTVTGTWWLDIDAAEAANPGMFIGKALTVTLTGAERTGQGDSGVGATLTARVQKR